MVEISEPVMLPSIQGMAGKLSEGMGATTFKQDIWPRDLQPNDKVSDTHWNVKTVSKLFAFSMEDNHP